MPRHAVYGPVERGDNDLLDAKIKLNQGDGGGGDEGVARGGE